MYVRSVLWRRDPICGLCNSTKEVDGNLVVVDCHTAYHVDKKLYTTTAPPPGITTECSVVFDLTDE